LHNSPGIVFFTSQKRFPRITKEHIRRDADFICSVESYFGSFHDKLRGENEEYCD